MKRLSVGLPGRAKFKLTYFYRDRGDEFRSLVDVAHHALIDHTGSQMFAASNPECSSTLWQSASEFFLVQQAMLVVYARAGR
jgi:hypothetical protein